MNLKIAIMNFENDTNIGGLIRTASAAGIQEVIIVGKKDWNKGAATGAQNIIKITRIKTPDEFIEHCKNNDYQMISVEIDKDSKNIFDYQYPKNPILIIGNEGKGISKKILEASCATIYIPQYGNTECLNAAVAGSIAIYDWVRKNNTLEENEAIKHKFYPK